MPLGSRRYVLSQCQVSDGATTVLRRSFFLARLRQDTRTDALNLTNIWDNVVTSSNQSFWASPANRLQNAEGPWGSKTFFYSGVDGKTLPATNSRDLGGAEGDRTPDLVIANDALSQLSYGPMGPAFRS